MTSHENQELLKLCIINNFCLIVINITIPKGLDVWVCCERDQPSLRGVEALRCIRTLIRAAKEPKLGVVIK